MIKALVFIGLILIAPFVLGDDNNCISCHQERKPSTMLFNRLAVFRISAHRKSDISNLFDPSECVNCHYTQAVGHGEDPLADTNCGQCHSSTAKGENLVFGPFHLDPSLKDQLLVFSVEVLNIIVVLGVLVALAVWVIRGFLKARSDKATERER